MTHPVTDLDIKLLNGLAPGEVNGLFGLSELREFHDHDVIIAEGEEGDALFVVRSGQVRVEKATLHGKQEFLTRLGPGECFGEMSLVDREPRSATVRAEGSTSVHTWVQENLERFFRESPETHRKILKNLVKIASGRLRRLDDTFVQSAFDSVIRVDASCRVLEWTRITDRTDLLSASRTAASPVGSDLFEVVPQLGTGLRAKTMEVVQTRLMTTFPLEYEPPSGTVHFFEVTIAPPVGADPGAVIGLRNVTDVKTLEARLIGAEKLATAGRMSAEIGHELNNHLMVLSGNTELLLSRRGRLSEQKSLDRLQAISDQLEKMKKFARGLLDLGIVRSRREKADLNSLLRRLVEFIQGQRRFREIEFVQSLDPELPALEIDLGQFQQVLLNLYANAAEAMGRGRIETVTRYVPEDGLVMVEVKDDGPGMPDDERARIFDHGFTTKDSGHGFGLAICRRIVENHKGTIDVDSAPGRGSTFILAFRASTCRVELGRGGSGGSGQAS